MKTPRFELILGQISYFSGEASTIHLSVVVVAVTPNFQKVIPPMPVDGPSAQFPLGWDRKY